jgi:hypothetical protein
MVNTDKVVDGRLRYTSPFAVVHAYLELVLDLMSRAGVLTTSSGAALFTGGDLADLMDREPVRGMLHQITTVRVVERFELRRLVDLLDPELDRLGRRRIHDALRALDEDLLQRLADSERRADALIDVAEQVISRHELSVRSWTVFDLDASSADADRLVYDGGRRELIKVL